MDANTTILPQPLANATEQTQAGIYHLVLGVTLLFTNIFIIILNTLTILVIIRFRHKNIVDFFVLALAITDLIKGLVPVPISTYIYTTNWYLKKGSVECDFFGWIAFVTNSGSMLILTLLSIERFWAVVKPFSYKRWVTPRKVQLALLCAMLFTAIHSALPVLGVGEMLPYNKGAYSHFDYSRNSKGSIAYSVFIIFYGFSMVIVVMVMYGFVFYKIRNLINRQRRMSIHRKGFNDKTRGLDLKTEKMFLYLAVALMVLFWFSWLPFLMVVAASQLRVKTPHKDLDLYAIRIAVINSLLNPITYATLCKPYRRGILYYFRVLCSYAGFSRPESNIWDPWRRKNPSSRENLRPQDRTSVRNSELVQSSFTDSCYTNNTDYSRHRLPSTLETYDSFRAHRRESNNEESSNRKEENTRLPTVKENHISRRNSDTLPAENQIPDDVGSLQVSRSIDSGIEGSPYIIHEPTASFDYSRSPESLKDHSRVDPQHFSGDGTAGQSRKLQLLDKVQKYLGVKRTHVDRRVSKDTVETETDLLLPINERTVDGNTDNCDRKDSIFELKVKNEKTNGGSTRLEPNELANALNKIVTKSLQDINKQSAGTIPRTSKNSAHSQNNRVSRSCTSIYNSNEPETSEEKDIWDEKLEEISKIDIPNSAQLQNSPSPRNHDGAEDCDETAERFFQTQLRPRCSSEGGENKQIQPIKLRDVIERELKSSEQMIHRIKEELENFPDSTFDLSRDFNLNNLTYTSKIERNTVCF